MTGRSLQRACRAYEAKEALMTGHVDPESPATGQQLAAILTGHRRQGLMDPKRSETPEPPVPPPDPGPPEPPEPER